MASVPPRRLSVRPPTPELERDRVVLRWAAVIDKIDYLSMLRLPKTPAGPSDADVRRAYRTFARAFHPDHFRAASQEVRDAAAKVFSAGAEAYGVLSEPLLRVRYLKALAGGQARPRLEDLEKATREDARAAAQPAAALAKTPGAKAHGERADKMIELGELAYAKAALEQAVHAEPGNAGLAAKLAAVEARLYAPRRGGRR
ncbi:MAG: DnaJ domain-containing protein [Deltaproteobacteria bacterium]|nr:DnaJ domain-containing protein [Deltaproteobacteria bacterium]